MDFFFFFFKQKTAYEITASDWSSDVCSSDLMIRRQRPLGRGPVEADRIREWVLGIEPAKYEAGIGHRRLHAPPSVGRRPRLRASTARADPERATFVHRRNTAAAGAYRLDEDGGKSKWHARDRFGPLSERHAAADETRVGARAAHIERQEIVCLHGRPQQPGPYDAAGRTGECQTRSAVRSLLRRHGSPARRHDPERLHAALLGQRPSLPQIRRYLRPQVRLGGRRARALLSAKHGKGFVTGGDRNAGQPSAQGSGKK